MSSWSDFHRWVIENHGTSVCLDVSDMRISRLEILRPRLEEARGALRALEAGTMANPDENRQVGHYWLRSPELAPDPAMTAAIKDVQVQASKLASTLIARFRADAVLHIGIGGSALGPQLVVEALAAGRQLGGIPADRYRMLDNTDPEGFALALEGLDLNRTLVLVVSKSGGTPETLNGLAAVRRAYATAGVPEALSRFVAITEPGSRLDGLAADEGWGGRLPMWPWVGGRTSVWSAVGLLPMALLGVDAQAFLDGGAKMDRATRGPTARNPAALLAAAWFESNGGAPQARISRSSGDAQRRAMVVLPYSDRLRSFGRYLQQLVMESLGKRVDRHGRDAQAGLVVYGNKGSTDQHAYVQQLRDGPDEFFCCFVELLRCSVADPENPVTQTSAGDTLAGLLDGTRAALGEDGKRSFTVSLDELNPRCLGAAIALFERAVGFYAELLDVNAYNQPGVEAGKKAATAVLAAQRALRAALDDTPRTAESLCEKAGLSDPLQAWRILRRLAAHADGTVLREVAGEPRRDRFLAGPGVTT
jgi:glucose-6-phosphate isomerase